MRRLSVFAVLLLLLTTGSARAEFGAGVVMLEHAGRPVATFAVEVATSSDDRALGLMDRDHLDANKGMLFDYGQPTMARMWMRRTLIPLDMVFIDADGVIQDIHANAAPKDETVIASPVAVRWVLEIPGGRASAIGLKPGDRMKLKTR